MPAWGLVGLVGGSSLVVGVSRRGPRARNTPPQPSGVDPLFVVSEYRYDELRLSLDDTGVADAATTHPDDNLQPDHADNLRLRRFIYRQEGAPIAGVPTGSEDDWAVLVLSSEKQCAFVSNDEYSEYTCEIEKVNPTLRVWLKLMPTTNMQLQVWQPAPHTHSRVSADPPPPAWLARPPQFLFDENGDFVTTPKFSHDQARRVQALDLSPPIDRAPPAEEKAEASSVKVTLRHLFDRTGYGGWRRGGGERAGGEPLAAFSPLMTPHSALSQDRQNTCSCGGPHNRASTQARGKRVLPNK